MQWLLRLPLIFFFAAAGIGLLLRWHFYSSLNITYPYWLHAHSHVMFFGWVFNALSVGYVLRLIPIVQHHPYKRLLIFNNLWVVAMLIAFPLQGYGLFSILFSSLHTTTVFIFTIQFFRDTKVRKKQHEIWSARMSLIFFLISSLGPFVVGALSANGLGKTDPYYLAVYYFLHFQYNGVFVFGVLALWLDMMKAREITLHDHSLRVFRNLLLTACFPAYLLSTLWTNPGILFNFIGFIAGLLQVIALVYLAILLQKIPKESMRRISFKARMFLALVLVAFIGKIFLQLISAHPDIARMAFETRNLVIAYLHLVLIGVVTFFLLAWYHEHQLVRVRFVYAILFLSGFLISQLILISSALFPISDVPFWIVVGTAIMMVPVGGLMIDALMQESEKSGLKA